jgi:hypothetical protein
MRRPDDDLSGQRQRTGDSSLVCPGLLATRARSPNGPRPSLPSARDGYPNEGGCPFRADPGTAAPGGGDQRGRGATGAQERSVLDAQADHALSRWRDTALMSCAAALSTCSPVVGRPILMRSVARASARDRPIAVRTCEGLESPELQADPVEIARPRISRTSSSASIPGTVMLIFPARR